MRLFIRVLLLASIWISGAFAATLATASAGCVGTGDFQTSLTNASASCSYKTDTIFYSGSASASALAVSATSSASPAKYGETPTYPGSVARFEGDYLLTMLGGVGSGVAAARFSYEITGSGTHGDESATVFAIINGQTAFYAQNDFQLPWSYGGSIPFTFGQPAFFHIRLDAIVEPSGHGGSHSVLASLSLADFHTESIECPYDGCITSSQFTLVAAPEPVLALPLGLALLLGLWRVRRPYGVAIV